MAENITLNNVATFQNDTSAVNTVNTNNAAITTAFTDVLSRSGVSPNPILSTLDMNGNQIINLPFPTTLNSPARLADVTSAQNITIVNATTGTSGHTVPFLDGVNTWSAVQNLTAGLNSIITNPGSFTSSNVFNQFAIGVDNLDASGVGNIATNFNVFHSFGGSSTKGSRQAFTAVGQLTSPTSATNTSRFYVGGQFLMQAVSNDGGGVGTEKGSIFGGNSTAIINAAATNMAELCGHEFNTTAVAGSTVLDKWGFSVVQPSNDAVSGSRNDAAVRLTNQAGAVGWNRGIQFGDGINQFPVKSSGTLIKTVSGSVTNGADFSVTTFSGNAFASPGFAINGTGQITTGSSGVSSGNVIFNGTTSGFVSVFSSATGNLLTVSQPIQVGTIGSIAGQINIAGQTSGSAQLSCSATGGTLLLGNGNVSITTSGNTVSNGNMKVGGTTAAISGGDASNAYFYGTGTLGVYFGVGAPTITAAQGSLYIRTDGTTNVTRAYINTTGSTTWTAINTVA